MGSSVGLFAVLLAVLVGFWWLAVRPRRSGSPPGRDRADVDQDTLDEAEREVQKLDALTRPEDADDELPDWGPGAPKT